MRSLVLFALVAIAIFAAGCVNIVDDEVVPGQQLAQLPQKDAGQPAAQMEEKNESAYLEDANGTSSGNLALLALLLSNSTFTNASQNYSGKLNTSYFYSPNCAYCRQIAPLIENLQKQFQNNTTWGAYNVMTPEGYAAFEQMAKKFNLPNSSRVAPLVAAGNQSLIGGPEIN